MLKRSLISCALACAMLVATAGDLPKDTAVRVEGKGIEPGWFTGKTSLNAEGCTMVKLDRATRDKYTMLSLTGVRRLQRQQAGQWVDVPLAALLSHEPKPCLVEGSD
jgi:hypothetical protein